MWGKYLKKEELLHILLSSPHLTLTKSFNCLSLPFDTVSQKIELLMKIKISSKSTVGTDFTHTKKSQKSSKNFVFSRKLPQIWYNICDKPKNLQNLQN